MSSLLVVTGVYPKIIARQLQELDCIFAELSPLEAVGITAEKQADCVVLNYTSYSWKISYPGAGEEYYVTGHGFRTGTIYRSADDAMDAVIRMIASVRSRL